jgi:hypothetical protein
VAQIDHILDDALQSLFGTEDVALLFQPDAPEVSALFVAEAARVDLVERLLHVVGRSRIAGLVAGGSAGGWLTARRFLFARRCPCGAFHRRGGEDEDQSFDARGFIELEPFGRSAGHDVIGGGIDALRLAREREEALEIAGRSPIVNLDVGREVDLEVELDPVAGAKLFVAPDELPLAVAQTFEADFDSGPAFGFVGRVGDEEVSGICGVLRKSGGAAAALIAKAKGRRRSIFS